MVVSTETASALFRVRLRESNDTNTDRMFVCEVTPDLSESQSVNYKQFDPVHAPGSIMTFVNSPSRTFGLSNVKLISTTRAEASKNLKYLSLLRSWTKPVFGSYTVSKKEGNQQEVIQAQNAVVSQTDGFMTSNTDVLGAPPKVLLFSAYSDYTGSNGYGNINRIPVVLTSLEIQYPSDVDYIPANEFNTPVPVIQTISFNLVETHSASAYRNFSIANYRQGTLVGF